MPLPTMARQMKGLIFVGFGSVITSEILDGWRRRKLGSQARLGRPSCRLGELLDQNGLGYRAEQVLSHTEPDRAQEEGPGRCPYEPEPTTITDGLGRAGLEPAQPSPLSTMTQLKWPHRCFLNFIQFYFQFFQY